MLLIHNNVLNLPDGRFHSRLGRTLRAAEIARQWYSASGNVAEVAQSGVTNYNTV